MKIYLFIICFIFISTISYSQSLFTPNATIGSSSNGNIGVGTNSPETKLEVVGSGTDINIFKLSSFDSQTNTMSLIFHPRRNYLPNPSSSIKGLLDYGMANQESGSISFNTSQNGQLSEKMRIRYDGNVGIGTASPKQTLDISAAHSQLRLTDSDDGNYVSLSYSSDMLAFRNNVNDGSAPILSINDNGYVGIGTGSPDSKLAVNGTIHTKEVKVDLNGWSDFVFESDYELRTLEEVEQHIIENRHLPEIPSEAYVTENGINLGEMNAKLLQKIEELTLYLIEQNKQNLAQQKQLEAQSEIIEQLKKEVYALKNE